MTFLAVVETPEFIRRAHRLMSDEERESVIGYLASHPTGGVLVPGAGGIRKLRWAWKDAAGAAARGSSTSMPASTCRSSL